MKTPEDIKKALECCSDADGFDGDCIKCPYKGEQWCEDKSKIDALAYIQRLEAMQPKWISVEENPPEIGQRVIAMDSFYHIVHSMILMKDGWYFDYPDRKLNYKASIIPKWWIPAPNPPKVRA